MLSTPWGQPAIDWSASLQGRLDQAKCSGSRQRRSRRAGFAAPLRARHELSKKTVASVKHRTRVEGAWLIVRRDAMWPGVRRAGRQGRARR